MMNSVSSQSTVACGSEVSSLEYRQIRDVLSHRGIARNGNVCVALQAHIVTKSDMNGGTTTIALNYALSALNAHFKEAGISFYWAGAPQYIVNTDLYDFGGHSGDLGGPDFEGTLASATTESYSAINIFFLNSITKPQGNQVSGYTYLPVNDSPDRNRIFVTNGALFSANGTMVHEMGHYFGLLHTHHHTDEGPSALGSEHVARTGAMSNCSNSGDLICDTEADPGFDANHFDFQNCRYTGTAADIFGLPYQPMTDNIMSYYPDMCGGHFTEGQIERILQGLSTRLDYNTYDITGSEAGENAPYNTTATLNANYASILIDWDFSGNNMGFLVERDENNSGNFKPIVGGATNPNVTFFEDTDIQAGKVYAYRIRTVQGCKAYGNVATVVVNPGYCNPTYTINGNGSAYIEKFELSIGQNKFLTHYSGWTPENFEAVMSLNTHIESGRTHIATIRTASNNGIYMPQFIAIWADLNADLDFDDAGECLLQTSQAANTHTLTREITFPAVAASMPVRMRVRTSTSGMVLSPCATLEAGETEDYTITLTPATFTETSAVTFVNAAQQGTIANVRWQLLNAPRNTQVVLRRLSHDGEAQVMFAQNLEQGASLENFEFSDLLPADGLNTYAVQLLDENGDTLALGDAQLDFEIAKKAIIKNMWPNPASTHEVSIEFQSPLDTYVRLRLSDINGHTHYTDFRKADKGINTVTMPITDLPSGQYFVSIEHNVFHMTQTLQIIAR